MDTMRETLKRLHDSKSHLEWKEIAEQAIANKSTSLPELFDLLQDPDPSTRVDAVRLIAWFGLDDEITSHLRLVANDPDYEVRLNAGLIFLDSNDPHFLLPLLEFLVNDTVDYDLWMGVPEYIRVVGPASLPEIAMAMSDQRPEIRRAAAGVVGTAAGYLRQYRTPPELIVLMTDDDHKVREEAILAIRNLRDYSFLPNLINAVQDSDPEVQHAARITVDEFKTALK